MWIRHKYRPTSRYLLLWWVTYIEWHKSCAFSIAEYKKIQERVLYVPYEPGWTLGTWGTLEVKIPTLAALIMALCLLCLYCLSLRACFSISIHNVSGCVNLVMIRVPFKHNSSGVSQCGVSSSGGVSHSGRLSMIIISSENELLEYIGYANCIE